MIEAEAHRVMEFSTLKMGRTVRLNRVEDYQRVQGSISPSM